MEKFSKLFESSKFDTEDIENILIDIKDLGAKTTTYFDWIKTYPFDPGYFTISSSPQKNDRKVYFIRISKKISKSSDVYDIITECRVIEDRLSESFKKIFVNYKIDGYDSNWIEVNGELVQDSTIKCEFYIPTEEKFIDSKS